VSATCEGSTPDATVQGYSEADVKFNKVLNPYGGTEKDDPKPLKEKRLKQFMQDALFFVQLAHVCCEKKLYEEHTALHGAVQVTSPGEKKLRIKFPNPDKNTGFVIKKFDKSDLKAYLQPSAKYSTVLPNSDAAKVVRMSKKLQNLGLELNACVSVTNKGDNIVEFTVKGKPSTLSRTFWDDHFKNTLDINKAAWVKAYNEMK